MLSINAINAQIEELKYLMKFNCETSLYDVMLKVEKGSAENIIERAQFNSQISIVVPTGKVLTLENPQLPLQDNQNYMGTTPMVWNLSTPIVSPEGCEGFDFYSIMPSLTPASFYNNIDEGDKVLIFSFSLGENTEFDETVRFFDNGTDPKKSMFEGSDLRNGFAIGGSKNLYRGNIHQDCTTTTDDKDLNGVKIFPNPAIEKITIDAPNRIDTIKILDIRGKRKHLISNPSPFHNEINISAFSPGLYFIVITTKDQTITRQISIL